MILAVTALATFVSSNLNAAEPLRSPRAQENQVCTVPGNTEDHLQRGLSLGSPRGNENEQSLKKVAGGQNEPDLLARDRGVTASPRALEMYPQLADSSRAHNPH